MTAISIADYPGPIVRPIPYVVLALTLAAASGCSSSMPHEATTSQPPPSMTQPRSSAADTGLVSPTVPTGTDTVQTVGRAASPRFRYRFDQTTATSSGFTFQDRELSFFFTPEPSALNFQVENRQDRPVWIDWDRSTFIPPVPGDTKVAHRTTRYEDRYRAQPSTQIPGLGRYSDYVIPMDYLIDPATLPGGATATQAHKPLFPEDNSAPQYDQREFGIDLIIRIEDKPRTYNFRFRVQSVLPR